MAMELGDFADFTFLRRLFKQCVKKDDYKGLEKWFKDNFVDDFTQINQLFSVKKKADDPENGDIDLSRVYMMSEIIHRSKDRSATHQIVLDRINSAIFKVTKSQNDNTFDGAKASFYFVVLHLPLFIHPSSFPVLAKLLELITHSPRLVQSSFRAMLQKVKVPDSVRMIAPQIRNFVNLNVKATSSSDVPCSSSGNAKISIADVENASQVLQTIFTCSSKILNENPDLCQTLFVCSQIEGELLMSHFSSWAARNRASQQSFNLCDYTFLISAVEKRKLIALVSEQEMVNIAKGYFTDKVKACRGKGTGQQGFEVSLKDIFLEVKVRRSHLVADSLKAIKENRDHLRRKLRVAFEGEQGVDLGGLAKEWFMLLIRDLTDLESKDSVVVSDEAKVYCWLNGANKNLEACYLFGCLLGLAIHNSVILAINMPLFYFKKLLSPAVYRECNPETSVIGSIDASLDDLLDFQPQVAKSLKSLLEHDGDVEHDFCLNFTANVNENGKVSTYSLKSNGADISVTNQNRKDYVSRYLEFTLNRYAEKQFRSFYKGFHHACDSPVLRLLTPSDLQRIICGQSSKLDCREMRRNCKYEGGFSDADKTIDMFWNVLEGLKDEEQKIFLVFLTGCNRVPIGGFKHLKFVIKRVSMDPNCLPVAHTCFNELQLPPYQDPETLKLKLLMAIENCQGYGLE